MKGVIVTKLKNSNNDEKGTSYKINDLQSESLNLFYRKKDKISGQHYHTGINPFKNPEKLILVQGKCKLYCQNIDTKEEKEFLVEAPAMWSIMPRIYHEVQIIENCIYIEPDNKDDNQDMVKL